MKQLISLFGFRFGRLLVISKPRIKVSSAGYRYSASTCICDCGKKVTIRNESLKIGNTRSCGCLHHELLCKAHKHGHARRAFTSPTFHSWYAMKDRCENPKNKRFERYGGRGIIVCKRWANSFSNFLKDLGERPFGLTLGRIDNDKGYFPKNVRWETAFQQTRNTSRNKIMTVRGKSGCLAELCEHFKISYYRTRSRLRYGWDLERALFGTDTYHKQPYHFDPVSHKLVKNSAC